MTTPNVNPPPAPSFRPSRNPIVRLFLWFTEPSMIKGIAVGIVLALIGGVALKLNAAWYIASGLMLVIVALVFGAVVGHYIFEYKRKRVQRQGLEMLRQAGGELPGLGDQLAVVLLHRDTSHLPGVWDRLRRLRPAVEELAGLGIAAFFRISALSALFAVLGSAISFAVFLTSYMQVERMTEQNDLVKAQTALTEQQIEWEKKRQQIEISLSIADRRQTTLREMFAALAGDPKRDGKLSASTELLLAAAVAQLAPYRTVDPDAQEVAGYVTSPEQEQLLRYLSAIKVDVSDLDLRRAYLAHADLHGIELPQIQLSGVSLRNAALYDANFTGANFAMADLSATQFARTDLSQAILTDAKLFHASLVDSVLTQANLVRADLSAVDMRKAVLKQAQLGSARLWGADLSQCDLSSADITDADIALADLSALEKPALVPKIRGAASWWLAVYSDDYAAKLGVSAAQLAKNREAYPRLRAAATPEAAAAIIDELRRAAPTPPS